MLAHLGCWQVRKTELAKMKGQAESDEVAVQKQALKHMWILAKSAEKIDGLHSGMLGNLISKIHHEEIEVAMYALGAIWMLCSGPHRGYFKQVIRAHIREKFLSIGLLDSCLKLAVSGASELQLMDPTLTEPAVADISYMLRPLGGTPVWRKVGIGDTAVAQALSAALAKKRDATQERMVLNLAIDSVHGLPVPVAAGAGNVGEAAAQAYHQGPVAVVYWNGQELGHTSPGELQRGPTGQPQMGWRHEHFSIVLPPARSLDEDEAELVTGDWHPHSFPDTYSAAEPDHRSPAPADRDAHVRPRPRRPGQSRPAARLRLVRGGGRCAHGPGLRWGAGGAGCARCRVGGRRGVGRQGRECPPGGGGASEGVGAGHGTHAGGRERRGGQAEGSPAHGLPVRPDCRLAHNGHPAARGLGTEPVGEGNYDYY
jgi:hypothetical protein